MSETTFFDEDKILNLLEKRTNQKVNNRFSILVNKTLAVGHVDARYAFNFNIYFDDQQITIVSATFENVLNQGIDNVSEWVVQCIINWVRNE